MKKTLALVLALVMVLALVPAAFADAAQNYKYENSDGYKVTVTFAKKPTGNGSIETTENAYDTSFTATGKTPSVTVKAPIDAITTSADKLWTDGTPQLHVKLETLGGASDKVFTNTYTSNQKVYVNGIDVTSSITSFSNGILEFDTDGLSATNAVYSYEVKVVGTNTSHNDDTMTEIVNFTIAFNNTKKNVYELKFNQPDPYQGVELKDGVYFIDSVDGNPAKVSSFKVNVAKNDGSKFTEPAYYAQVTKADATDYPVALFSNKVKDSKVVISPWNDTTAAHSYKVTVETEYAIYHGEIKVKYRTNVQRIDPKGIDFTKSEYTIGVNEVLTPAFNTVVPVWHNVASFITLSTTTNSEKGIVDVDNTSKTITGLREGTVYVTAEYNDKLADGLDNQLTPKTYTDTVKVTVKGTYQVTDKANYVVTTKSGNLNVRASASTSAKKIGSLKKGEVVEVVEIKDGWAKIVYPAANYTNGYVSTAYLTKQGTKPETVVGTKTVIARVLNVRSGAGTSYSIVGKLTRNTKVEVIETVASGKWAKIKFNDSYAYVSCTYLQ